MFTARYALSPYIKQTRLVLRGLICLLVSFPVFLATLSIHFPLLYITRCIHNHHRHHHVPEGLGVFPVP